MSAKHNAFVRYAVIGLFLSGGPTAIIRLIISVIVGPAVYGVQWAWALAHIGEETFKSSRHAIAIQPTTTNCYPAFFVMLKCWTGWLRTARNHIIPTSICRACLVFPRMTVNAITPATVASWTTTPSHAALVNEATW